MAEEKASRQGEGLSLQTLIVAAVASGVAAVVVSHLWHEGTVLAAAMTPVFVAILKEALQRPIESDVVRRSASKVGEVATARRAVSGLAAGRAEAGRRSTPATGTVPPPPPPPSSNGQTSGGDVVASGPRRTYATTGTRFRNPVARLRGRPLRVAIATGLLAFVVAVVVLTVPELIFGGS